MPAGIPTRRPLRSSSHSTPDVPASGPLARGHSGKALLGRRLIFPGDQSTHALAAATGFVSTAADLTRFFGQLAPGADPSILSVASRREMSRPQWKDAWSPLAQSYGLGTISGSLAGWETFGHSGGFQGYVTRTAVVPTEGLTVSCLTNAVDGLSYAWLEGMLAILKRFREDGPPNPDLADWTGRWWSVWGATDLVPIGDKVLLAAPGLANPVLKAGEVTVAGPDQGWVSQASAFANHGEPASLVRGADGAVVEVRIGGGRSITEAALAAELVERYER